jgi:hypothetical protein
MVRGIETEPQAEALKGALLINPVVYAELSVRYPTVEAVDAFVSGTGLEMAEIPRAARFLAAKAFAPYRRAGGIGPGFFRLLHRGSRRTA